MPKLYSVILAAILAVLLASTVAAGDSTIVIDKGDIDRLIIKLPAKYESGHKWTVPYADSILDWMILPRDLDSLRQMRPRTTLDRNADHYWLGASGEKPMMILREQNRRCSPGFDRVVIFAVGEYMAYCYSFYTFWKPTPDGLRLIKIKRNPIDQHDWFTLPEFIACFPDGSLLLAVKQFWADAGDATEYYHFLRMNERDELDTVYSIGSSYDYSGKRMSYDDRFVYSGNYQITVMTQFFTNQPKGWYYYEASNIDSAKVEIVDLWQKAIEKFDIDTTQIE